VNTPYQSWMKFGYRLCMKYNISRSTNEKNTMKIKTIMMGLMFGTSLMVANANIDYTKSGGGERGHEPVWNDHQLPPSQSSDEHGDTKVATYSAVPEASAIFAAAMLLLPLGASTMRGLRRNKKCVDQIG